MYDRPENNMNNFDAFLGFLKYFIPKLQRHSLFIVVDNNNNNNRNSHEIKTTVPYIKFTISLYLKYCIIVRRQYSFISTMIPRNTVAFNKCLVFK